MNTVAFSTATPLLARGRRNVAHARMCAVPEGGGKEEKKDVELGPAPWVPVRKVKSNASWKYQYVKEFKKKGTGSEIPYDLRPVSLRDNDDCPMCEGTGLIECSLCFGYSHGDLRKPNGVCSVCNVKPVINDEGRAMVTCGSCLGTGKAVELTDGWWDKGIEKMREETIAKDKAKAQ